MPYKAKNIALTGFMAVGKSSVGRKLASKLKRPFVDLDQAIEEKEGMKVRDIFDRKGEAFFREREKEVLREVLDRDGQVIATGGGAVLDKQNLRLLKNRSLLICLTAPAPTLLRRSGSGEDRPLLRAHDRQRKVEEILQQRKELYAQAHICVDTDRLTIEEVVDTILKAIDQPQRPSRHPSRSGRGRVQDMSPSEKGRG
ncbi:MAG: shikimate kinase [Deltaproteobacteria bacterium]|nr:shikimate kinase [Deltaproteobacteria bacterium]